MIPPVSTKCVMRAGAIDRARSVLRWSTESIGHPPACSQQPPRGSAFGGHRRARLGLAASRLTEGSELTYLAVAPGNRPIGPLCHTRKGATSMRLDKRIAELYALSRRAALVAVRQGQVDVNGQPCLEPALEVEPKDQVVYHCQSGPSRHNRPPAARSVRGLADPDRQQAGPTAHPAHLRAGARHLARAGRPVPRSKTWAKKALRRHRAPVGPGHHRCDPARYKRPRTTGVSGHVSSSRHRPHLCGSRRGGLSAADGPH